jgi:hypothetical protein
MPFLQRYSTSTYKYYDCLGKLRGDASHLSDMELENYNEMLRLPTALLYITTGFWQQTGEVDL